MTGRLIGKTALVTGAGGGIGGTTADRFLREGARVIYSDVDFERVMLAAGESTESRAIAMDVSSEKSVSDAWAVLTESGWVPDVVVANAGIQLFGRDAEVADLDLAVWQRTMAVNLTGAFLTVKYAVRGMLKLGGWIDHPHRQPDRGARRRCGLYRLQHIESRDARPRKNGCCGLRSSRDSGQHGRPGLYRNPFGASDSRRLRIAGGHHFADPDGACRHALRP